MLAAPEVCYIHMLVQHACACIRRTVASHRAACPWRRELDVSLNQLSSLDWLRGCSSLQSLRLDGNRLQAVPAGFHARHLTCLSMSDNQLASIAGTASGRSIPPRMLRCNPHAGRSKQHAHAGLAGEARGASAGLTNCLELDTLLLRGNRLTALAGLSACMRLQHLDASFNRLADVPDLDLPCQRLRHLSLNGNRCRMCFPHCGCPCHVCPLSVAEDAMTHTMHAKVLGKYYSLQCCTHNAGSELLCSCRTCRPWSSYTCRTMSLPCCLPAPT